MFHRLHYEEWQTWFPIIGFFIFFAVFLIVCYRVIRMPRRDVERLEGLPFDDEKAKSSGAHS